MNLNDSELKEEFDRLFASAVSEDLSEQGDVTSLAIGFDRHEVSGIYSRQEGVVSGIELARECFVRINQGIDLDVEILVADGSRVSDGDLVMRIAGPAAALLRAERIALNFLGFFSGIAGVTARHVAAAGDYGTRILDTRKTLPGYRRLSKAAVVDGGGTNHRMGLYDMVMIKDNHVDVAGGIAEAVSRVRESWGSRFRVEVECRNLDEVSQALNAGIDVIMLDNMSYDQCRQALEMRTAAGSSAQYEASGDFTPERIREYADLALDFISVGGLTHSVKNHNYSMRSMGAETA